MLTCGDLIKRLSSLVAVSGHENTASRTIAELFETYCEEVTIDKFFNVIGLKKGRAENPKKVLICAHYDEIGLIITGIDETGFLQFSRVGGVDPKILGAQQVTVHGKEDLFGVIGAKPPHLISPEEATKGVEMEDMRIDIGMSAQKARELVSVGDRVSYRFEPMELKNNRIAGKTMDNRSSVAALVEILKELDRVHHDDDVYVVATVQEELGTIGAITAAHNIRADLGIAIDVCHGDMPEIPSEESFPLGKGVAIAVGPVLHKEYTKELIRIAKAEKIVHQIDPEPGNTGTDASALQIAREGIPTLLLSIPCKYMHTMVEMISVDDVQATARLAARYIAFRDGK